MQESMKRFLRNLEQETTTRIRDSMAAEGRFF